MKKIGLRGQLLSVLLSISLGSVACNAQKQSALTSPPPLEEVGPQRVVEIYCDLALAGKISEVHLYTTGAPKEYYVALEKEFEMSRQKRGKPARELPDQNNTVANGQIITFDSGGSYESARVVNEENAKVFFENESYIKQVQKVWINGSAARVRVDMGSRRSERYLVQRDFFLYKKDGAWKIFLVDLPSSTNTYGVPIE